MKTKFSGILALLLVLVVQLSFAQQKTVTGTVNDNDGLPLPGANVIIKGTSNGTQTDFDGNYSINATTGQILIFSYIGFEAQEITIGTSSVINANMATGTTLETVVITTYGVARSERDLATNVSRADVETVSNISTASVASALQGTTSGTQIKTVSGAPGAGVSIRVRGASSINGSNDPLFVVDGIPINSGATISNSFGGQQNSALSNLNPDDISDIQVLKDAAATALYGQRGSNGVILITTKKGKNGKLKVSLNNSVGFQTSINKYEKMNYGQWLNYRDTYSQNSGAESGSFSSVDAERPDLLGASQQTLQAFYDSQADVGDDYLDEVYQDEALVVENTISISGGTDKTRFFGSAGRFTQEGTVLGQDISRNTVRLNVTQEVSEKLTFDGGVGITDEVLNVISNDNNIFGVLSTAILERPGLELRDENGDFTDFREFTFSNPLENALSDFGQLRSFRVIGNAALDYKITEGLNANVRFGLDHGEFRQRIYNPRETAQGNFGLADAANPGRADERHTTSRVYLVRPSLNYNKKWENVELRAYLGGEYETRSTRFLAAQSEGFSNSDLQFVSQGLTPIGTFSSFSEERRNALISTLGFTFWNNVILEGSLRRDQSSKFNRNDRTGYFPGAAFAYTMSNEEWFPTDFLNYFKIRGSYGITGNDTPFGRFNAPVAAQGQYADVITSLVTIGSENARWERTSQYDVGFTTRFWSNKINLTYAYFDKSTFDNSLVFTDRTSGSQGNRAVPTNIAAMTNKGHEIDLGINIIDTDNFTWNNTFNFSTLDNEVTFLPKNDLGETEPLNLGFVSRVDEGEPLGFFYVLQADGLYQEGDVIPQFLLDQGVGPGDVRYIDQNGDDILNDDDFINGGDPWADYTINWTANMKYKKFDLSFLWNLSEGNDIFNNNGQFGGISGNPAFGKFTNQLDWWTPTNTNTETPRPNQVTQGYNNQDSTRFLEDGSYIKLRNLTIGYTLPQLNGVDQVRVYVSGDNLLLITDYSGVDPEVNAFGNTAVSGGTDFLTQGNNRTISFGANITF